MAGQPQRGLVQLLTLLIKHCEDMPHGTIADQVL